MGNRQKAKQRTQSDFLNKRFRLDPAYNTKLVKATKVGVWTESGTSMSWDDYWREWEDDRGLDD